MTQTDHGRGSGAAGRRDVSSAEAQSGGDKRRVFIVDDHPLVREGLARLISLQDDLMVCGEADGVAQTLAELAKAKPDVVLVDVSLKEESGFDLVREIRTRYQELPILVLSMHEEASCAERALLLGAQGYITKSRAAEEVLGAIREILAGKVFVSGHLLQRLLKARAVAESSSAPEKVLSQRELDVFELLGAGYKTRRIAAILHLSPKTVDSHCANIKSKLKLVDAVELVRNAVLWVDRKSR